MSDKKSTIPTEEELSEVKTYFMIHQGHVSKQKHASFKCYEIESECDQELIRLSLKDPNKRFYKLKTIQSMINKVKDAVIETSKME
jgi:hypothetical protein